MHGGIMGRLEKKIAMITGAGGEHGLGRAIARRFAEEGAAADQGHGAATPVGRVGRPDDVAEVAAFLAGDAAEYITGQSINVTGGGVMH